MRSTRRTPIIAIVTALVMAIHAFAASAPAAAAKVEPGFYRTAYDGGIYVMDDIPFAQARKITEQQWRDAGSPPLKPAPTAYIVYPWSPEIIAETVWDAGYGERTRVPITYQQWQTAGFPTPLRAPWSHGNILKYATSSELLISYPNERSTKLTYAQWQSSGFQSFTTLADSGYVRLPWSGHIIRMSSFSRAEGNHMSGEAWDFFGRATPRDQVRIAGDEVVQVPGSPALYYQAPPGVRAIGSSATRLYFQLTYPQWVAMGSPAPRVTY